LIDLLYLKYESCEMHGISVVMNWIDVLL